MHTNFEIHDNNVEIIEISPNGEIYIEDAHLYYGEMCIDIKQPFQVNGLDIIQADQHISFESIGQLNYFTAQINLEEK